MADDGSNGNGGNDGNGGESGNYGSGSDLGFGGNSGQGGYDGFGSSGSAGENTDPGILVSPDVDYKNLDPGISVTPDVAGWKPENSDWTPRNWDMSKGYMNYSTARLNQWVWGQMAAAGLGPDPVSLTEGNYYQPATPRPAAMNSQMSTLAKEKTDTPEVPTKPGDSVLSNSLGKSWEETKNAFGEAIGSVSNAASQAVDNAKDVAQDIAKGFGETVSKAVNAAEEIAGNVVEGTAKAADAVGEGAGQVFDAAKYGALGALNTVLSSTATEANAAPSQTPAKNTESEPKPDKTLQQKIGDIALKAQKDYSDKWRTDVAKDNSPVGTYKCNKFVADVIKEAGSDLGLPNRGWTLRNKYPPTAKQLADPEFIIPGWVVQDEGTPPQSGDIVTQKRDYGPFSGATGHTMLVVEDEGKLWLVGTGVDGIIVKKDLEQEMKKVFPPEKGKVFFRRFDPDHLLTHSHLENGFENTSD